jgi:hypothetical protein
VFLPAKPVYPLEQMGRYELAIQDANILPAARRAAVFYFCENVLLIALQDLLSKDFFITEAKKQT